MGPVNTIQLIFFLEYSIFQLSQKSRGEKKAIVADDGGSTERKKQKTSQVKTLKACLDRLPLQLCHVSVKAELQIRHEEFICVCPLPVSLRLRSITVSLFFP